MPVPFPITDWQTAQLRVTLFVPHEGTGQVGPFEWWGQVVGNPPETRTQWPRSQDFEDSGPVEGLEDAALLLKVGSGKVDWFLTSTVQGQPMAPRPPVMGTFPDSLAVFAALIQRWMGLPTYPELASRLAFGAVLLHSAPGKEAAYRELSQCLAGVVQLDIENASDFSYQINRPRESRTLDGVQINRLTKWSAGYWHLVEISPAGAQTPRTGFVSRLELDINNAPDHDVRIPRAQAGTLLEEEIGCAREIAEQGDIA